MVYVWLPLGKSAARDPFARLRVDKGCGCLARCLELPHRHYWVQLPHIQSRMDPRHTPRRVYGDVPRS